MNQEQFFVSVIIPVYNGEKFLASAIKNVLEQNYQPLEIIVVDDGSNDGTAHIAAQFNNYVCYVYQSNRGPAAARNRGIQLATGNLIAFLDVDDLWSKNKLNLQISYLNANPSIEIVQGLIQELQLFTSATDNNVLVFQESSNPYDFINLGSAIYRKSVFNKVGLFDESLRYNEDTDWFFRAWENNISKFVLDEVTLFYRKHDGNMTNEENSSNSGFVMLFKKHLDRCRQKGNSQNQPPEGLRSLSDYIGWSGLEAKREKGKQRER